MLHLESNKLKDRIILFSKLLLAVSAHANVGATVRGTPSSIAGLGVANVVEFAEDGCEEGEGRTSSKDTFAHSLAGDGLANEHPPVPGVVRIPDGSGHQACLSNEEGQPCEEEEDEGAGAGSAGLEAAAAAEALAGEHDDGLRGGEEEERADAVAGGDVGVVDAVVVQLLRVGRHRRLAAALLGGDGEAEGDDVEEEDGGEHDDGRHCCRCCCVRWCVVFAAAPRGE